MDLDQWECFTPHLGRSSVPALPLPPPPALGAGAMVEGVSCHEHYKTSFPRIIYVSTVESMNKGLFYIIICCQQIILVQIDEIYL